MKKPAQQCVGFFVTIEAKGGSMYRDDEDIFDSIYETIEEEETTEEDIELLRIMHSKIGKIKTFSDPLLQRQYEELMSNEEDLLSLDSVIAMGKVRLGVILRKGRGVDAAQMLRAVTDAVEHAILVRERQREYVHLEQVLWLVDKMFEIANDEVSNQEEVARIAQRFKRLRLLPRHEVPLEQKRQARALSEGRIRDDIEGR